MYQVPKDPQGRPVSGFDWLRDLSALTLAIVMLVYGVLDSERLGELLSPFAGLGGVIVVIALCITLSKRYGESKLKGQAQLRRAWLHLFAASLILFVIFFVLDNLIETAFKF
jgi:hypothetical protein